MSWLPGKKVGISFFVLMIVGVFFLSANWPDALAYHETTTYEKLFNDTLTSDEWNDLFDDFVNTWQPVSMSGPLGIGMAAPSNGRLAIDGRVGIGTATPDFTLDVNTAELVNYTISAGNKRIGNVAMPAEDADVATKGYLDASLEGGSGQTVGYWALDGNNLFASSTDWNVGIGTTTPANKLTIQGSGSIGGFAGTTANAYLRITDGTGSIFADPNEFYVSGGNFYMGTLNNYDVKIGANAAEVMTIKAGGNVGIGTTAPTAKLDVVGSARIGVSNDVPIKTLTVAGNFNFDSVANPTNAEVQGMVLTNGGAGSIQAGTYYYAVAYVTSEGETGATGLTSSGFPSITLATDSRVDISNIPISSDPRVTGRKIYRSQAGTVGDYYYLYYIGIINNNTTTTYTDNSPRSTTATDWIYNKNNTTAGIIYRDGISMAKIVNYVTAFGSNALANINRGSTAAAFGSQALQSNTTGSSNHAFGHAALSTVTTGSGNVGMGYAAGQGNQIGSYNVSIGMNAGRNNTSSSNNYNTGIGTSALYGLTTNNIYNTGLGAFAGQNFQGAYNTFLGANTGYLSAITSIGDYNTFIGYDVGDNATTGADNNILIGNQIDLPVADGDNQLSIGNLIFGTGLDGTGTTVSSGNIGIGTTTPAVRLEVVNSGASNYTIMAGGKRVGDVALPVEDYDVVTKGYVDATFVPAGTSTIATFVGVTASTYNGNNGGTDGYATAHAICALEYADSHVCATFELLNFMENGGTPPAQDAWIFSGPPGYTALANDCDARTDNTSAAYGTYWQKPATGYPEGRGLLMQCNNSIRFACCQ
ncbi:MAG: hypothetical protein WC545_03790 [Patescibacteria group bacterium]